MPQRPLPRADRAGGTDIWFEPAWEVSLWVSETFLNPESEAYNPDHDHLRDARLAFLWTNAPNSRYGVPVVGQAEKGEPTGSLNKWTRARLQMQLDQWAFESPDFLITLDANYWLAADHRAACATLEHELYHCAQEKGEFGEPKFNRLTGRPAFTLRGHDVEEFVGVVRRYGPTSQALRDMIEHANEGPEIAAAAIAGICGTCGAKL